MIIDDAHYDCSFHLSLNRILTWFNSYSRALWSLWSLGLPVRANVNSWQISQNFLTPLKLYWGNFVFPWHFISHHFSDEYFPILTTKIPYNQGITTTSGGLTDHSDRWKSKKLLNQIVRFSGTIFLPKNIHFKYFKSSSNQLIISQLI